MSLQLAERLGEGVGLVLLRAAPQDDALARHVEMAGDLGDLPVFGGDVVERAAVAIDLLVDIGAALEHAPGIVVDHVGEQQVAFAVEAELDLEIDQRAAFELPGFLQHEESLARDAPHLGKEFRIRRRG